jgi:hypothetical protein
MPEPIGTDLVLAGADTLASERLQVHVDGDVRWRWPGLPDPDGGVRFGLSVYAATPDGHVVVGLGFADCRLLPADAREVAAVLVAQADAAERQNTEPADA